METYRQHHSHPIDSLAKHTKENINLSSLTPMTNKEIATFGDQNPDTYDKCFSIAGVTYPAAPPGTHTRQLQVGQNGMAGTDEYFTR